MKLLGYLESHKIIERLCRKKGILLNDDLRSKIIYYSGRLDCWIEPLIDILGKKPQISEDELIIKMDHYFTQFLNSVPQSQQIALINPFLAAAESWLKINQFINKNSRLFSPLFDHWLKKKPLFDTILKPGFLLTKAEEKLIRILFNKFNQIISRDEIAQGLWNDRWLDKYSDWMIDTLIYRLRKKIRADYQIITVKSRGYLINKKSFQVDQLLSEKKEKDEENFLKKPQGVIPSLSYLRYMNNPKNPRKVLADLFVAMDKEQINRYLDNLFNQPPINILVINSYSFDNVDALADWLIKQKITAKTIFSNFDEGALNIHQKRIETLGFDNIKSLFDDIRQTRLAPNSFRLVINDFRLNFNSSHQQNVSALKNIYKLLKPKGYAIISTVVDCRYDSPRFGTDQEKAPINKSSPWTFIFLESLRRYCFTVPYYKKLFTKTGFKIIKEFDIEEGKGWTKKYPRDPSRQPNYRRFLLMKKGYNLSL
jgi:DNA-binding winged helix-turn-helix (wHTH) protein/ubiquinone/menaquinone biosynthesis C-methylase UbiE